MFTIRSLARRYFSATEELTSTEETQIVAAAMLLPSVKFNLIKNTVTALNNYFRGKGVRETKYPIFLSYLSVPTLESNLRAVQIFVSMLNGVLEELALIQKDAGFPKAKFDVFMNTMQVDMTNGLQVSGVIFKSKYYPTPWQVKTDSKAESSSLKLIAMNTYEFPTVVPDGKIVEAGYRSFFYFVLYEVFSHLNITKEDIRASGVQL